jgi:hypothetical protein
MGGGGHWVGVGIITKGHHFVSNKLPQISLIIPDK